MHWDREEDMIFDTHAHYDDEVFDGDRDGLLKRMHQDGIGCIVNIGAGVPSTQKTVALSEAYDFIYAAVGVHPSEVADLTDADIAWLKELAGREKVLAVGEIGLDYHYDEPAREVQIKWFKRQLELAREVKLPVCIHSRDAAQDTLEIMKEAHSEEIGGVIHCFSYSWGMAEIYLAMGFYLGIGGVVTFKNSRKLKEVVEKAPMEQIVLETDAPYLSPEPYRGMRNTSLNLKYVAEQIAELKGMTSDEVIRITWDNARKLYRMD